MIFASCVFAIICAFWIPLILLALAYGRHYEREFGDFKKQAIEEIAKVQDPKSRVDAFSALDLAVMAKDKDQIEKILARAKQLNKTKGSQS